MGLDPEVPAAAEPKAAGRGIAFGLERLAFIPFRAPSATIVVALAIAVLAVLGIQRIKTDDSLSQLFRSKDPAFKQFEQVSREFPSSEYDVLIVVSGQSLLARESVEKLRSLAADVQLIDGTRGVLSMFSAREPAPEGGLPSPLFPDPLPEGSAYDALIKRVMTNEIIRGKLLSDNGKLAVGILSLETSAVESEKLDTVLNDIRRTAEEDLQDTGLTVELTGVPVMQAAIRHALERDRVLYNAVGFALGCGVARLFFRRVSLMLVAASAPLMAIVFALGALGWLGFRLNMFLNVMTPLIMVISFSDSMQLTFAARDQLMAGKDKRTAFRDAIRIVGPACVLTHAAAGLSLLGLLTSSSDLIRGFGEAGFLATAIALVTVLSLVPSLGVLLIRDEARLVASLKSADPGVTTLRRFCDWIARRMVSHPALFSLVDLVIVAGLAVVYSGLEPSYRLADEVPDKQQALTASGRLDSEISGSNPMQVLITFPPGLTLYAPETLATIADVQRVLEGQPGVGNVWSLESLRRWLAGQMAMALATSLIASQSTAWAASPFEKFIGAWSGSGQIVGTNGNRESIRCRAQYTDTKAGSALNQSIVCASESFKLNITSYVEVSGDSVQGYWKEASRDVSGHVTGRISAGRFEGEFSAPTFSAVISLTSNGHTQAVSIQPRGGDVSDVRIQLRR